MADGTLRFDTEIDESGFQKGLKRIEQAAKGATQQTASDAQDAAKQAEQKTRRMRSQMRQKMPGRMLQSPSRTLWIILWNLWKKPARVQQKR